jgi:hypothetical protein
VTLDVLDRLRFRLSSLPLVVQLGKVLLLIGFEQFPAPLEVNPFVRGHLAEARRKDRYADTVATTQALANRAMFIVAAHFERVALLRLRSWGLGVRLLVCSGSPTPRALEFHLYSFT